MLDVVSTAYRELENNPTEDPVIIDPETGGTVRVFTHPSQVEGLFCDGVVLVDDLPDSWFMAFKQKDTLLRGYGVPVRGGSLLWYALGPHLFKGVVGSRFLNDCWWSWQVAPVIAPVTRILEYFRTEKIASILHKEQDSTLYFREEANMFFVWGNTYEDAINGVAGKLISL